jgi:hypothetical protein
MLASSAIFSSTFLSSAKRDNEENSNKNSKTMKKRLNFGLIGKKIRIPLIISL